MACPEQKHVCVKWSQGPRSPMAGSPRVTIQGRRWQHTAPPPRSVLQTIPQVQLEVAFGTVVNMKTSQHTFSSLTPRHPQISSQSHLKSPKWWFPSAPLSYRPGTKHQQLSKAVSLTVPWGRRVGAKDLEYVSLSPYNKLWGAHLSSFYESGTWVSACQADERQNQGPTYFCQRPKPVSNQPHEWGSAITERWPPATPRRCGMSWTVWNSFLPLSTQFL